MASHPRTVGFIGLGNMGLPMARNLAAKLSDESEIYVYDIVKEAIDTLCQDGARSRIRRCDSAKSVAEHAVSCNTIANGQVIITTASKAAPLTSLKGTILTMLPEGKHVQAVYTDPQSGILSSPFTSPKLLIDCSTIDAATSLSTRDAVLAHSQASAFYDAPVSGGVLGAEKGTMTFMLGCAESDANHARIHALLSLMGGNIFACGGPSLGITAKLCNNYCSGLIAIATSEAMSIGIASGMDPRVLSRVFGKSLAQSCINDKWNPVPGVVPEAPASKDYAPGFRVGLMRKDFGLAVEAAERLGVRLALGEKGLETYEGAERDERCRDRDSRVVFRYLGGDEKWMERFED